MKNFPKVALIGRVNVGKSTLFNCLIGKRKALISKIPGTTRDRNYGECVWRGKKFILIDLAGVEPEKREKKILGEKLKEQIERGIEEADLILFVLDIQEGVCPVDKRISKMIKKSKKETILVLNKADNQRLRYLANEKEFWRLGFGLPIPVSAINGAKTGDLLDLIVKKLKFKEEQIKEVIPEVKVAIIGRPNVGKSTLLNSILGEERVIVSPIPQTTREPQDTLFFFKNTPLLLIDTAGIRRKRKIKLKIEKLGVKKTIEMIEKADIVLLLLDIKEKVSHQDKALFGLVTNNKKALILVINKCDLIKDFEKKMDRYISYYQNALPMAWWVPIIFISAKEGKNIKYLLNLILEIKNKMRKEIKEEELDRELRKIVEIKNFKREVWRKIYLKQISTNPFQLLLLVPKKIVDRKLISQAQVNIIKKRIMEKFNLYGLPIEIKLKEIE